MYRFDQILPVKLSFLLELCASDPVRPVHRASGVRCFDFRSFEAADIYGTVFAVVGTVTSAGLACLCLDCEYATVCAD